MSTTKQPHQKTTQQSSTSMSVGGFVSAIVVVLVFIGLAVLLTNRSNDLAEAEQMPQTSSDDSAATAGDEDEEDAAVFETAAAQNKTSTVTDTVSSAENEATPLTYDAPPPMIIDPEKDYTATITTPRGDIVVELRPDIAPITVNNFVFLAREGFYDGLTWHRVIEGFMAQGGDPTGTGMGGPGYSVPAEFSDQLLYDRPGILAMARASDPDSAGSQFFITTAPAPSLNEQYTAFGEVIEGQEIVDNIPLRDPNTATEPGEKIVTITIEEENGGG